MSAAMENQSWERSPVAPPAGVGKGAIRIDNVNKVYDPEGAAVQAVDNCTLDIAAGEICMVVGPSGCGKTTLLNAAACFLSRVSI